MERQVSSSTGVIIYELQQKNIKKMYLRVQKDGRVTVSAPNRVPLKQVDDFVSSNQAFILQGQQKAAQRQAQQPSAPSFETGDSVYYLGESLDLQIDHRQDSAVRRESGMLHLELPLALDCATRRSAMIEDFFTQEIQWLFPALMEKYQNMLAPLHIPQSSLRVKKMKSQWGSCHRQKNVITLNSSLIHLPLSLIEYVVLHEFCHYIHGNHSSDFYGLVAVYMPDWKARRQALKPWAELV